MKSLFPSQAITTRNPSHFWSLVQKTAEAIASATVVSLLVLPAFAQEEDVTLKGDSLQTVESRSTRDFPGLSSQDGFTRNPEFLTDRDRPSLPQLRLNEKVDVLYREHRFSGDSLGLFTAPGDTRPSGTVNLRWQLEE